MSVRAGTWNLGNRSTSHVLDGLEKLAERCEILGVQEAGDRGDLLKRFARLYDWDLYFGDGSPGAASVPILWNPRHVLAISKGTRKATPSTNAGRLGAGPSVVKAKVWQRVRFEVDAPDDLVFINGHLPASNWAPGRRRLSERCVSELADMVRNRREAIDHDRIDLLAVMDGNAKPGDRLWRPLRSLGMRQETHAPTHGRRTIDLGWSLGARWTSKVIDMPSDHRAVIFTKREK